MLVAPQEFKGTLTAVEAAAAIESGLRPRFAAWRFDSVPMADGGPGTTDALVSGLGGELRYAEVHDPHMRLVQAAYGLLPGGRAVVECAAASGLLRLKPDEINATAVRQSTSFGTGELLLAAMESGASEVVVGLGGSGTNDGGAGMAQALGFSLLDERGDPLPPGGAALRRLDRIVASGADERLSRLRCLAATDVTNPLCGREGATAVYGPQKGADREAIEELDAALERLAAVVERDLGTAVRDVPGAGAAGGLGAAVIAFLGGEVRPGAEVVAEAAGLKARVDACDLVVTGEGRLDGQTLFGKTTAFVASVARRAGKPVVCLAGSIGEGHEAAWKLFDRVEALTDGRGPPPGREESARLLAQAAVRGVGSVAGEK